MAVFVSRALAGGDANIPAPAGPPTFPDVPADWWAFRHIEFAVSRNIVEGFPEGDYRPLEEVNRGQMAAFLARSLVDPTGDEGLADFEPPSTPTFPDVPESFWAFVYIEFIVQEGVTEGFDDNRYHPEIVVDRAQMAVFIFRGFDLPL